MIRRVRLQNFKAHAELDLKDIPPLAVIAGPNNVGKSAILHALAVPRYGLANEDGLNIGPWNVVPRVGTNRASVQVEFDENPGAFEYDVAGSPRDASTTMLEGERKVQTWVGMHMPNRGRDFGLWVRVSPNPLGSDSNKWSETAPVRYISALRGLPESFDHQPLGGYVGTRGQFTGNILHELIASRDPRFDLIEGWAKKFGLDLDQISSRSIGSSSGLTGFTIRGVSTDSNYVGSGTLAVLPILVQGVLCQEGETLLVEEPESHLHRGAMNGLWRFFEDCRTRGVQVIATTHSLDLLESLYRRVSMEQVNGDETALFDLEFRDGTRTDYERIPPAQIQDYRDRINQRFAAE